MSCPQVPSNGWWSPAHYRTHCAPAPKESYGADAAANAPAKAGRTLAPENRLRLHSRFHLADAAGAGGFGIGIDSADWRVKTGVARALYQWLARNLMAWKWPPLAPKIPQMAADRKDMYTDEAFLHTPYKCDGRRVIPPSHREAGRRVRSKCHTPRLRTWGGGGSTPSQDVSQDFPTNNYLCYIYHTTHNPSCFFM